MTVTCPNCGSEIPIPNRKSPYSVLTAIWVGLNLTLIILMKKTVNRLPDGEVLNFSIHVPPKPSKQPDMPLWQQCLLSEALNLQKIKLPN